MRCSVMERGAAAQGVGAADAVSRDGSATAAGPRTAKERLLAVLGQRSLTPLEALEVCHLMTLAQRICEFRRERIQIGQDAVALPSGVRVARYWLAEPLPAALAKWRARSAPRAVAGGGVAAGGGAAGPSGRVGDAGAVVAVGGSGAAGAAEVGDGRR